MVAENAKVILVTGSSRGLGKSIALELGQHGQKVVINYVSDGSKGAAEATVAEVKALGGDAIAVQADSTFFFAISSYCPPTASLGCLVAWFARAM
jgi:3-oxoacyl-[acyl-carrier protein] reductase